MAESGGLLIIDGEDAGSTPWEFDSLTEAGSNTFALDGDAANNGSYGYKATLDGSNADAHGVVAFGSAQSDIYVRTYVYISSGLSVGDGGYNYLSFLYISDSAGGEGNTCAFFAVRNYGGNEVAHWYVGGNGASDVSTATNFSVGAWHYVELHYVEDASVGGIEAWVDGTQIVDDIDQDSSGRSASRIYAGAGPVGAGVIDDAADFIYIDDLKADTSYVGAYSASSANAVPILLNQRRRRFI